MWLDLRGDLTYALRTLRRAPGFTVVAILSLALGIGANALVFSVVNALVLEPLPVAESERLMFVQAGRGPSQSYPNYVDFRDRNVTLDGLIGYRISPMSVEVPRTTSTMTDRVVERAGAPARAWGYLATGNYFDVLGVQPAAGRFFHQEDDQRPGAAPYAVLSFDEWQARFGGDAAAIGSTIRINKQPFTIIGVAPRGFHGTELFYRPAIWVPMMMEAQIEVGNAWLNRRATMNLWLIGRLKRGVTAAQAEANLNAIAAALGREYPWPNRDMTIRLTRPGLVGTALGSPLRGFALGVLALAGLVLLAACANLASLLAARGADRRREMAVRISIGAGRGRLVRQLLTESLVLSSAGGLAGAALATLLARALSAWRAPIDVPVQLDVTVDGRVLLFAFALSLVAGVLFGVAPARFASATDPNVALKGTEPERRLSRRWAFRDLLVAAQVAICFVLVSACFISVRGLQRALVMPLGFEPRGVALASFELGLAGYDQPHGQLFQRRALEEATHLPGVKSAAYSNSLPLSIDQSHNSIYPAEPQGHPTERADAHQAVIYEVSPGFFATMGVRVLAGRDFDWHDTSASPPVAIVNEAFARQILRTRNPLGARFRYGPNGAPIEVVGLVEDGKYQTLAEAASPAAFNPAAQWYNSTTVLEVRSALPEDEVIRQLRDVIARLDPTLPIYDAKSLTQMLGLALFPSRAAAIALSAFGLLALTLAATGLHGLVSYGVARRTREIGIRVAVGASAWDVLRVVLGRTALLLGAGAATGAALALLAGQVVSSIVYSASPRDPVVLAAVAVTMIAIGVASCWVPARRALRINPVTALRLD